MLKKIIYILPIIYFVFGCSKKSDEICITVDDNEIKISEFESRLNSIPQTLNLPESELKKNITATLIAEQILAKESQRKNLDTLKKVRILVNEFNDEALYENWMDEEVRKKINVSEEEIKRAYLKFKEERLVNYWIFNSEDEALTFKKVFLNNELVNSKPETKNIEFSVALPEVEDAIYNLKINEISDPIIVDNKFYLFQLKNVTPKKEIEKYSFNEIKPNIEQIIRNRKEKYLVDEKVADLMQNKSYSVNRKAFDFLYNQLCSILFQNDKLKYDNPEDIQSELYLNEVNSGNNFNQTFVTFQDNESWSLSDMWNFLSVSPYPLNYKTPDELKIGILDVLRSTILLKSIAKDSREKQFGNNDYVIQQSELWKNNIYAQVLIKDYKKNINVDDEDLEKFYNSNKYDYLTPEKYKIIPLVVKDADLANGLYQKVKNGEDIIKLGKKFSINKLGLSNNNTGIFITKNMWGEIGKTVSQMKINEISKPIISKDGTYTIVKLLEYKKSEPYQFYEVKEKIKNSFVDTELQLNLNHLLEEVVNNYNIEINEESINKVKYYSGNMGVKKNHFPLRSSVPMFPLFDHKANWFKKIL